MSNELNILSTQKNQLIQQRAAIINSSQYNAAREDVNKNAALFRAISEEVDLANARVNQAQFNVNKDPTNQQFQNTLARQKEILAQAKNTQRTINSQYTSSSRTFNSINRQATNLQDQIGAVDFKIGELALAQTSSFESEDLGDSLINNVQQAGSPVPAPPPQENQPVTAVPDDQASYVLSDKQIEFLELYNKELVKQGFDPVDSDSFEALEVILRNVDIDDDEVPRGIRVNISEANRQDDFLSDDLEGDPAIDSQVIENFDDETQIQTFTEQAREQVVGQAAPDWRVRISLAEQSDYFYNAANPGILKPLAGTNGVIFPYTPQITVNYVANYNPLDIVHTNYKFYSYKNSSVESVMIAADFTAQNTVEANYMLAVIHFFRSLTKMFYGQDQNPSRGVPPPLCYLKGYGAYQFDNHPMVITNFTYNLPVDVDYITAYPTNPSSAIGGIDLSPYTPTAARSYSPLDRLRSLVSSGIDKGGLPPPPTFNNTQNINEATRVPTKINIQLSCLPIATRNAVSNKFSLRDYANGSLLRGSVNPGTGGGFW
jgi:hypothetical protein